MVRWQDLREFKLFVEGWQKAEDDDVYDVWALVKIE